jgi:hypothetical protein
VRNQCENLTKSKPMVMILLLALSTILVTSITFSYSFKQHEAYAQIPKGTSVNSKFLTVTESRYRSGGFSDQITGTVTNNSTQQISSIFVYVALYDKDNKLITMDSGLADVTTLAPRDQSAFSITLLSLGDVKVDHYTIFPGGLPG